MYVRNFVTLPSTETSVRYTWGINSYPRSINLTSINDNVTDVAYSNYAAVYVQTSRPTVYHKFWKGQWGSMRLFIHFAQFLYIINKQIRTELGRSESLRLHFNKTD